MGGLIPSSSRLFADAVGRYGATSDNPQVHAVEVRLRAPLSVSVLGRPGVGRDSVARALAGTGVRVVTNGADARIVVIAEALKPEDLRVLRAQRPAVIVLNKADLAGRVVGGPLAEAGRAADAMAAVAGVSVIPMIAHLAAVELDDELIAALRTLVTTPADVTSVDAFVEAAHPLPSPVRQRLITRLDRFGIAHAVLAVGEGAGTDEVVARLRTMSRVGEVVGRLGDLGAEIGYRRVCSALSDLRRAAAESRDDELAAFLAIDEVVLAVMAAAVDVMAVSGVRVDPGDDRDTHLRRAVRWRRHAEGPLDALHRRCAADISRGSLRLLDLTR